MLLRHTYKRLVCQPLIRRQEPSTFAFGYERLLSALSRERIDTVGHFAVTWDCTRGPIG